MKYERWLIPETDDAAVEALMDAGYPYLVSTVLASRGVVTPEQAAAHLDRERSLVYSPFLMRDMDKDVCKINIDSDLRLAMTGTIRQFMDEHPDKFDPREYLKPARANIKELVRHKLVDVLGCAGKA